MNNPVDIFEERLSFFLWPEHLSLSLDYKGIIHLRGKLNRAFHPQPDKASPKSTVQSIQEKLRREVGGKHDPGIYFHSSIPGYVNILSRCTGDKT